MGEHSDNDRDEASEDAAGDAGGDAPDDAGGEALGERTDEAAGEGPAPSGSAPDTHAAAAVKAAPRPWPTLEGSARLGMGLSAGLAFLVLCVLPPLSKSGLWDPYELGVSDLARRYAVHMFGAATLALDGADNSLPHLNDLGRPELSIASIALGFRLFGLHEWAGRLPLAIWAILGVLVLYACLVRFVDRRAAVFSTAVLVTMPLFYVQARSILGDIVTIAGVTIAFAGATAATFGGPMPAARRAGWVLIAAVGAGVGYASRGALFGIAVPFLGVGIAWALARGARVRALDAGSHIVGAGVLAVGVGAFLATYAALTRDDQTNLHRVLGFMVKPVGKYPTFETYVGHLGHSLAPWSAFVPFALGRMFSVPAGIAPRARQRESMLRLSLLTTLGCAFSAHAVAAAYTTELPFVGVALIAGVVAIAIRDYDRGAHPSLAVGVGTIALTIVLHHDMHSLPEKAFEAFAVSGPTFPDAFKDHALTLWTVSLGVFAAIALVTWVERDVDRRPFDVQIYLKVLRALKEAWDGTLALMYFALVAGASLAGLVIWIGVKTQAKWLPTVSVQVRDAIVNAWWVAAFAPLLVIFGAMFAADLWLWAFGRARPLSAASFSRGFEPIEDTFGAFKSAKTGEERFVAGGLLLPLMLVAMPALVAGVLLTKTHMRLPAAIAFAVPSGLAMFLGLGFVGDLLRGRRAAGFVLGGALAGAVICVGYYPALANQLSPKDVFEAYARAKQQGEPLGLYGVSSRTAAYYAGGQPPTFIDPEAAREWLGDESGGRRFLAISQSELPRLNQAWRRFASPRANLPILDARSSQILLASSSLRGDEKSQNPLDEIVLPGVPAVTRPLTVNLDDKLELIGVDIWDATGKAVESVSPVRPYRFRTYYRVLAPISTEWQAFIHIDGSQRRHNGDHRPTNGKYPMSLWLAGDIVVDDHEFKLEPNFSPGNYTIYFGFFLGDTRLKVKSGPQDGSDRVIAGRLVVQ